MGESGSGKTTVALALLGHARGGARDRGRLVAIDGHDLRGSAASGRARAGRLLRAAGPARRAEPGARIGRSSRELIEAHDKGEADPEKRIADVLERMHLPTTREFLRRYPHQLSGGQQQRVCIALAFSAGRR